MSVLPPRGPGWYRRQAGGRRAAAPLLYLGRVVMIAVA